jgi:hypothetical protein
LNGAPGEAGEPDRDEQQCRMEETNVSIEDSIH